MNWLETHRHLETYKGKHIFSVRRYRLEGKSPYKKKVVYDPEDAGRYRYTSVRPGWMGFVYSNTLAETYKAIDNED